MSAISASKKPSIALKEELFLISVLTKKHPMKLQAGHSNMAP